MPKGWPAGQPFDLPAALPQGGTALVEHPVWIGGARLGVPAQLVLACQPAQAAPQQQECLRRRASRTGKKTDPRMLQAVGFMMVLTFLAPDSATSEVRSGSTACTGRWNLPSSGSKARRLYQSAGQRSRAGQELAAGPPHHRSSH